MDFNLNPKQFQFIVSEKQNTGFVAGLGSGKSYVGTIKCIMKKLEEPTLTVAYYLPNYGLIRDIAFDKFPDILGQMGLEYRINISNKEIFIKDNGKIIFRSMDTPETIVGYEVYYSLIDECDILNMDKMTIAYNKILSRNRQKSTSGKPNQIDVIGTPEGFKWFYKRYVKNFDEDRDLLIRASTYDNKHLPDGYIDQLKSEFPDNLIDAYLNGIFVNLTSGVVYNNYDRVRNRSTEEENGEEPLFIGMDFNVTKMSAVIGIWVEHKMHIVEELKDIFDTPSMIVTIQEKYGRGEDREIHIYPDASGGSRKTVDASTTDIKLLKDARFKVHAPNKNPMVKDRIVTVNTNFQNARKVIMLYINDKACPELAQSAEQLPYDKNGEPDKTIGLDHILDGLGYLVMGVLPIKIFRRKKNNNNIRDKYIIEEKSDNLIG